MISAPSPVQFWFSGSLSILGEKRKRELLGRGRRALLEARVQVLPILNDVRDHGDEALLRLTRKWDGAELERLAYDDWEWKRLVATVPARDRKALEEAAQRIRAYHAKQVPEAYEVTQDGVTLGWKPVPLDRVGIYVPGGQASYPSTMLMAAIPAKLAGVEQVVACSPPRSDGTLSPLLLAAAEIAGVDEIYRVGGAQAVFGMAYGTRQLPAVQKIVGPGNVYVQAAKQLVQGQVGLDALAGPSEVLVIADDSVPPALAAHELAAQAEHDANACVVLAATSPAVAKAVEAELHALVPRLERAETIRRALAQRGALIDVPGLDAALDLSNEFAPEHLVLLVKDPRQALDRVRAAGSVFLGPHAPVALGDYGAGTNHILPTSGGAHFSSGLSVLDFVRFVQWQHVTPAGLQAVGPNVQHLALLEGLQAHAAAVETRLKMAGEPRPARGESPEAADKPARRSSSSGTRKKEKP